MRLDVAFLPEEAGDVTDAVCIVVDVLRATTVLATLFERGCPVAYVADEHGKAERFARDRGFVLCGESHGLKAPGFDYGNSPTEFAALDFSGRPAVLSTTNGTRAASMVSGARRVYLGAAVNLTAVAQRAWREAMDTGSDLVVVCSGTNRRFTLEDTVVAGMFVEALTACAGAWEMPSVADSAIAARRLWEQDGSLLRSWMEGAHAQKLSEMGFSDDVTFCASRDLLRTVPALLPEAGTEDYPWPVVLVS